MELEHLKNFLVVADAGNISAAAKLLGYSQSNLSRQMKALEDMLGVSLFERGANAVTLTPSGVFLRDEARSITKFADALPGKVRSVVEGPIIRIGYSSSWSSSYLPITMKLYKQVCPDVRISLDDISCSEMHRDFNEGKLDVVVSCIRPTFPDRMVCHNLAMRDWILLLAADHPLAKKEVIVPEDLNHSRFLVYDRALYPDFFPTIVNYFKSHGLQAKIAGEHGSMDSMQVSLAANIGLAFVLDLTEIASEHCKQIVVKKVKESPDPLQMYVGCSSKKDLPDYIQQFVKCLLEAGKQLSSKTAK